MEVPGPEWEDRRCRSAKDPWQEKCCRLALNIRESASSTEELNDWIAQHIAECTAAGSLLPERLRRPLALTAGVLLVQADSRQLSRTDPYCAATRIQRDLILTARHCVDVGASGGLDGYFQKHARFYLAGAPRTPARVLGLVENGFYARAKDPAEVRGDRSDYVLLRIEPLPFPVPALAAGAVELRKPVVIYAFSRDAYNMGRAAQASCDAYDLSADAVKKVGADDLRCGFRWDREPSCYVAVDANGCLTHGCQTEQGMSGAAIFDGRGAAPALIGIHLGSAQAEASDPYDCPRPRGNYSYGNKGLALDAGVLAASAAPPPEITKGGSR